MAYPDARFYLHTTSFDKVITKEKKRIRTFGPSCISEQKIQTETVRSILYLVECPDILTAVLPFTASNGLISKLPVNCSKVF